MKRNKLAIIGIMFTLLATGLSIGSMFIPGETSRLDDTPVFTGKEEHRITLETATRYVGNYRTMSGEQLTAGYMSRTIFEQILAQEGVVGIRIYNGRLDDGRPTYVIVGVDRQGNDLSSGVIGEDIIPCPPNCGENALTLDVIALR